ncbi:hypothetical protein OS493_036984 [Desmophyllum pertusum]|uniref:Uncharacterized protein n=1 Tax=Desmophyllum pertusum TaxID=174260 RepID=A0A9X0CMY9_9CNID|nr:hypothetical protein OS493_036984 [Desmophyllum pertusum]
MRKQRNKMAEEAKNIRQTAKGRFTRKRNELIKSIEISGIEIIESNYTSLVEAWSIVESKHDLYTMYLEDEEIEVADEWITNLQDLFAEAKKLKITYVNNITAIEAKERAEAEHRELQKREREQIQRMIDQSLIK